MIPRFYCPQPLTPGASLDLPDDAAHHAVRVLRMKEGDQVRLFDGRGGTWLATIDRLKPAPHVVLDEFSASVVESPLQVRLIQGLPASDKMDWVIQKCVELGVAAIQPAAARRSVVRLAGDKVEKRARHWQGVAVSACEQSGRDVVPEVAPLLDLLQCLARPREEGELRLVLAPGTTTRLRDLAPPSGPITVLIGPEGGLDEGEMQAAEVAGFQAVGLGPRVLRTETAGPGALAALMALWGDG